MKKQWTAMAAGGVLVLAVTAFARGGGAEATSQEAEPTAAPAAVGTYEAGVQPVAFPHNVHAGQYEIDCQYCHFSAERSVDAGIPPVSSCMGCHTLVAGQTESAQAAIAQVRDYYNRGEAIPWVRIYKISDHAHFPHLRHVAAGVECQTCHGQVEEMGVIQEVNQPLYMGWCIECHRQEEASIDCTACHY
jgi:hypothetical protein